MTQFLYDVEKCQPIPDSITIHMPTTTHAVDTGVKRPSTHSFSISPTSGLTDNGPMITEV